MHWRFEKRIYYMKIGKIFKRKSRLSFFYFASRIAGISFVGICILSACELPRFQAFASDLGAPIEKNEQRAGVDESKRDADAGATPSKSILPESGTGADAKAKDMDSRVDALVKLAVDENINEFMSEFGKFSDEYKARRNEYINSCRKLLTYSKSWDMSEAILKSLSDIGDESATNRMLFYSYSIKDSEGAKKFGERLINIYLKKNKIRRAAAECIKISNLLRVEYKDAKTALEYLKKWECIEDDMIPIAIASIYAKDFPEESDKQWEYYEKAAKMGSSFAKSKISRRNAAAEFEKKRKEAKKKRVYKPAVQQVYQAQSPIVEDTTSVGALDKNFKCYPASNGTIYSVAKSPNGYVVVGFFSKYNGLNASNICLLDNKGEVRKSEMNGLKTDKAVYSACVYDNNLVIGGRFSRVNGKPYAGIAVLDAATLNCNVRFKVNPGINEGRCVRKVVAKDGIIYFMGDFNYYNGKKHPGIYAVNFYGKADGLSPYLNLNRSVNDICFVKEPKKITANGRMERDPSQNPLEQRGYRPKINRQINRYTQYFNGKIIVGGGFSFFKNEPERKKPEERLNPLDAYNRLWNFYAFGFSDADGIAVGTYGLGRIESLKIKGISPSTGSINALLYHNGMVFAGGFFQSFNDQNNTNGLVALDANTLEVSEKVYIKLRGRVNALLKYCGNIIVGGSFTEVNGVNTGNLAIIDGDGKLNEDFAKTIGSGFNGEIYGLFEDLIVVGNFSEYNGEKVGNIARIKLP